MFRKKPQQISTLIGQLLKREGIATPLSEHHVLASWENIVGENVADYTTEKSIRNQVLFVKVTNPALRTDLSMMRTELVQRLNANAGTFVIKDIRFY